MPTTPMIRDQFEEFTNLDVMLRTVFMLETDVASQLTPFFGVENSTDAAEHHHGDAGFGDVPQYKGKIEYEGAEKLWPVTYTNVEYAKGLEIERALVDDAKYGLVQRKTTSFARAFARTVARAEANIFNNAFDATNYPGPDSVALCSANHDYSPTDTTEQVNYQALSLTHDNVAAVRLAGMGFKDPRGNEYPVMFDTLVVPTALYDKGQVIVNSMNKSGTADNDTNTNDFLRLAWSPYLTDTNAWFMVDSMNAPLYLKWYWRVRPEFVADPASAYDLMFRWRGYMRFVAGWDDYRWIYGCNPS